MLFPGRHVLIKATFISPAPKTPETGGVSSVIPTHHLDAAMDPVQPSLSCGTQAVPED